MLTLKITNYFGRVNRKFHNSNQISITDRKFKNIIKKLEAVNSIEEIIMFERAAIFSALLILILFCAAGIKYYDTLGLEPLTVKIRKQIGIK